MHTHYIIKQGPRRRPQKALGRQRCDSRYRSLCTTLKWQDLTAILTAPTRFAAKLSVARELTLHWMRQTQDGMLDAVFDRFGLIVDD